MTNPTYEGASQSPRMSGFMAPTIGPNTALSGNLNTLRGRSRQAIRNNPLAKGAQATKTANMVGTGITPRFNFKNTPEVKAAIQELWQDSVPELDWDETTDFYGQQAIVSNAVFSDGECLAMFRPRNRYADLAVPLQVQILEADHLDVSYTTTLPNGNKVRMGIEYNKMGKRVAYWLYKDHPGEMYMDSDGTRVRVLAKNIMHIFDPTRPGQQRGLPSSSSILVKLNEIDQCVDAELVRRKTTAMFGGFIKKVENYGQTAADVLGQKVTGTTNSANIIAFEPGTFPELPFGYDVVFSEPKDVGGNYVAWMKQQLMDLARGWGITYDQLTGDLSSVNYSSIRAGLLEFRRAITQEQNKTLVFQYCRPVIQRWLDTAVLVNAVTIPDYHQKKRQYYRGISWQPQPWPWIEPYKDRMAEILEMRAGAKNYNMMLTERGLDPESFFAQLSEELSMIDKMGFVFDTDPRKTTKTGLYQSTDEGGEDE